MANSSSARFYLTTPIYYASDVPHIGHAYTTIVADAIARYERMRRGAENVFFLTGTDEHGEKIERAATAAGMSPQDFLDGVVAKYKAMWQTLHISHDDFIRTTEPRHEKEVQKVFSKLREKGDIYPGQYEGLYCVACEAFYLEKDLLPGQLCPDHKRKVELVREEGFFFDLPKYQQALLDRYAREPAFVEPKRRLNEVRAFVEGGLKPLSVSRSSFQWGIPVPGAKGHIIYVWIDALFNYYSALQESKERQPFFGTKEEPLAVHLLGKEIVRFHAVYWPAMLMAADLPLPKKLVAHGWWTVDGEKMSKTLGNVVDPQKLSADLGADALRYFLMREIPLGEDGDFSYDALLTRYNSELANDLGNLLNRTLAMCEKYINGVVKRTNRDLSLLGFDDPYPIAAERRDQIALAMQEMQPQRALESLFALVRWGNTYLERTAPFTLAKTDLESTAQVLYNALELLRWIGMMMQPFLPERACELRRQLGLANPEQAEWPTTWGGIPDNTRINKGTPLFPRIDPDRQKELLAKWRAARLAAKPAVPAPAHADGKEAGANAEKSAAPGAEQAQSASVQTAPPAALAEISIDDFKRLDLRLARVDSCERVPKKDRLLKVELDLGPLGKRQVVAGIAELVTPEQLVGKTVVFLCNLKPAKIGGILSQGMILAVGDDKLLGLLSPDREIPPGSPIR